MAELVNAEEERIKLYGKEHPEGLEEIPRFEARYIGGEIALENSIKENQDTQILELGAGLSLHGLILTQKYPRITYIETDLPDIIQLKKDVIKKIVTVTPTNLHFAVANALDADALNKVLDIITTTNRQLIIYCEGFMGYLSLEEKQKLAEIVKGLITRYGGEWITPDPAGSIARFDYQAAVFPDAKERMKRVEAVVGQKYGDHAFKNEEDADIFFKKNGFVIKKISQPINLHSLEEINLSQKITGKTIEDIRLYGKVWIMKIA